LTCYIFALARILFQIRMNKSTRRISAAVFSAPLLPLLLLVSTSIAPAQQPAPTPSAGRDITAHPSERLIDASIADDQAVDKMLETYSPKVRALDNVIGTLTGELRKGGMGAGSLGNFVSDAMRAEASRTLKRPVDLAVVNSGGLRRSALVQGDLRARDIFELLPFENALVMIDLNGEQLMNLLSFVTSTRDAQSGARITYRMTADRKTELESARLFDEQYHDLPISPKTIYTVVTIDYLINRGGTSYGMLHEGKNARPLGITLRDAIMNYVKAETASGRPIRPELDGRFLLDKANSVLSGEGPPK